MAMVLLVQINPFFFTTSPPVITGEIISLGSTLSLTLKSICSMQELMKKLCIYQLLILQFSDIILGKIQCLFLENSNRFLFLHPERKLSPKSHLAQSSLVRATKVLQYLPQLHFRISQTIWTQDLTPYNLL